MVYPFPQPPYSLAARRRSDAARRQRKGSVRVAPHGPGAAYTARRTHFSPAPSSREAAMRTVIVFCSQTGSAKRYAHWLAEELGCAVAPLRGSQGGRDRRGPRGALQLVSRRSAQGGQEVPGVHGSPSGEALRRGGSGCHAHAVRAVAGSRARGGVPAQLSRGAVPRPSVVLLPGRIPLRWLGAGDKIMMRIYFKMLEGEAKRGQRALGHRARPDARGLRRLRAQLPGAAARRVATAQMGMRPQKRQKGALPRL